MQLKHKQIHLRPYSLPPVFKVFSDEGNSQNPKFIWKKEKYFLKMKLLARIEHQLALGLSLKVVLQRKINFSNGIFIQINWITSWEIFSCFRVCLVTTHNGFHFIRRKHLRPAYSTFLDSTSNDSILKGNFFYLDKIYN